MKTRLLLFVLILLAVCATLWWSADWFGDKLRPVSRTSKTRQVAQATDHPAAGPGGRFGGRAATAPATPTNTDVAPSTASATTEAGSSPADTTPAAVAMDSLRVTLRSYHSMYGGNPVGSNAEITRALDGANPRQTRFSIADGNTINDKGELADVWGTPYFFHQLSGDVTEIRSAGPDRTMWTGDDVMVK